MIYHNTAVIKMAGKKDKILHNNMFNSVYKKSLQLLPFANFVYFSSSAAAPVMQNNPVTFEEYKLGEITATYPLVLIKSNFDVSKGDAFATYRASIPALDALSFKSFGLMESHDSVAKEALVYSQFVYSPKNLFIKEAGAEFELQITIKLNTVADATAFYYVAGENDIIKGFLGCLADPSFSKFEVADGDDLRKNGEGLECATRPLNLLNYKKPITPIFDGKLKTLTFSLMPDTFDANFKVHEIIVLYDGKAVLRKPLELLQGMYLTSEYPVVGYDQTAFLKNSINNVIAVRDKADNMKRYSYTLNKRGNLVSDYRFDPFDGIDKLASNKIMSDCQTKVMFFVGKAIVVFMENNQEFVRLDTTACDARSVLKTFFFDDFIIFLKGDIYGKLFFDLYVLKGKKYEKKAIVIDGLYKDPLFKGFDLNSPDENLLHKDVSRLSIDLIHTYKTAVEEFRIGFVGNSTTGAVGVMMIARCKKDADGNYYFHSLKELPLIDKVAYVAGCKSNSLLDFGFICFGISQYSTDTTNRVRSAMIDANEEMTVSYDQIPQKGFNKVMPNIEYSYGIIGKMAVKMIDSFFVISYRTPIIKHAIKYDRYNRYTCLYSSDNDSYYITATPSYGFIDCGSTYNVTTKSPFINYKKVEVDFFKPREEMGEVMSLNNNIIVFYKPIDRPTLHIRVCENTYLLTNVNAPSGTALKVDEEAFYCYDPNSSNLNRRFYLVFEGASV